MDGDEHEFKLMDFEKKVRIAYWLVGVVGWVLISGSCVVVAIAISRMGAK